MKNISLSLLGLILFLGFNVSVQASNLKRTTVVGTCVIEVTSPYLPKWFVVKRKTMWSISRACLSMNLHKISLNSRCAKEARGRELEHNKNRPSSRPVSYRGHISNVQSASNPCR